MDTNPKHIQVQKGIFLDIWFSKTERTWWGRYVNAIGDQIGDAWFDKNRDYILIFRPAIDIK